MKNMMMRKENFLDEAYKLFQAGYKSLQLDKDEFRQEIENATTISYLASLKSTSIVAKEFGGWSELQSILKEGLKLIHQAKEAETYFERGQHILRLRIETNEITIYIEKNLAYYSETLLITENYKVVA